MRFTLFIFLIFLAAACAKTVEIRDNNGKNVVNDAYIRTTDVKSDKDVKEAAREPELRIINPKDMEFIRNSTIIVRLNISNFRLVAPDLYPKKGQGHVQVWLDDMEYRGSKTDFVFENESNGNHTIRAELLTSNNTVLPYSRTIRIFVNSS